MTKQNNTELKKVAQNGLKQEFKDRQIPIFVYLCLSCKKTYTSKEMIIKRLKEPVGFITSVCCCPFCKVEQFNLKTHIKQSELKKVINNKNQELEYKEANKWVKGLGHNDGWYLKEDLRK